MNSSSPLLLSAVQVNTGQTGNIGGFELTGASLDDEALAVVNSVGASTISYTYKIVISVMAAFAMTIAIIANVTLLSVVAPSAKRKSLLKFSRSNDVTITVHVGVLAVNDILLAILNGVLLILTAIHESEWFLGEPMCRFREPVVNAVVGVSCWLMMVIALERYRRLCNGARLQASHVRNATLTAAVQAGIVVAAIMAMHSLFSVPAIVNSQLVTSSFQLPVQDSQGNFLHFREIVVGSFCVQNWKSPGLFVVYAVSGFLLSFVVPLAVTVGIHARVISYLTSAAPKLSQSRKYLRKTTQILVAVLVTFAICWSPSKLLTLFVNLKTSGLFASALLPAFLVDPVIIHSFKLLTIVQSCINPILYGWCLTRRRLIDAPSLSAATFFLNNNNNNINNNGNDNGGGAIITSAAAIINSNNNCDNGEEDENGEEEEDEKKNMKLVDNSSSWVSSELSDLNTEKKKNKSSLKNSSSSSSTKNSKKNKDGYKNGKMKGSRSFPHHRKSDYSEETF